MYVVGVIIAVMKGLMCLDVLLVPFTSLQHYVITMLYACIRIVLRLSSVCTLFYCASHVFYRKSTFFNVLTKNAAPAENFPFCTIDPNESECRVVLSVTLMGTVVQYVLCCSVQWSAIGLRCAVSKAPTGCMSRLPRVMINLDKF